MHSYSSLSTGDPESPTNTKSIPTSIDLTVGNSTTITTTVVTNDKTQTIIIVCQPTTISDGRIITASHTWTYTEPTTSSHKTIDRVNSAGNNEGMNKLTSSATVSSKYSNSNSFHSSARPPSPIVTDSKPNAGVHSASKENSPSNVSNVKTQPNNNERSGSGTNLAPASSREDSKSVTNTSSRGNSGSISTANVVASSSSRNAVNSISNSRPVNPTVIGTVYQGSAVNRVSSIVMSAVAGLLFALVEVL